MFMLIPFISPLMDIIIPLESGHRELIWPLQTEYIFFDRENHFFVVSIHTAFATFNLMALHIAQAAAFDIMVEHACGLFSVVR